jgi:DNA-binding response OmpR family regulator
MEVLLVEDETKLADVIARNLRAHEFRVSVAATAVDALAEMAKTWPDALILDINLPDLTGWELLRKLPADQERPPLVVMSAGPISQQRIEEFRPERHIEKPFPMDALVRMLTELDKKSNGPADAGRMAGTGDSPRAEQ